MRTSGDSNLLTNNVIMQNCPSDLMPKPDTAHKPDPVSNSDPVSEPESGFSSLMVF